MGTQTALSTPKKRTATGTIIEVRSNGLYLVELDSGFQIQAHVGSTMKKFNIRILPGDRVKAELSPFDISRGKLVKKTGDMRS
tara:strand:- start:346 stop:594 length:249 start_codon:yes stop_codon:yes gene_type:complete